MKLFNKVKTLKGRRNNFDLRHDRKFSLEFGTLTPFFCEEVIPGDTWKLKSECLLRMAPMLAPLMHRVDVHIHWWFSPNRLVWNNWQNFITGGEDGNDASIAPYLTVNSANWQNYSKGTLADYLGYNIVGDPVEEQLINALPFKHYQLIYNEFYRDQNLTPKVTQNKKDGLDDDTVASRTLRTRAWEKDYFTSCLPWAQKGGQVNLPLGDVAPLVYSPSGTGSVTRRGDDGTKLLNPDGNFMLNDEQGIIRASMGNNVYHQADIDVTDSHMVDLSEATAASINDLRRASRLQEWLERNARGGSRYIESILHHFGVKSSDARLQRPEFLGGYKNPVVISEVLQSSGTATETSDYTSTPLGEMGGHGISAGSGRTIKRFFEEHGFIIGIMSVVPRTSYQQGLRRSFFRNDKFDYYWQEFAHLGEQPVLNKEVYNDNSDGVNDEEFGYQSRYAEYKYIPSTVHGDFKDNLAFWTMSRIFEARPNLNDSFITCSDARTDIFAVQDDTPKLWCQMLNNVTASRLMPKFGTPYL